MDRTELIPNGSSTIGQYVELYCCEVKVKGRVLQTLESWALEVLQMEDHHEARHEGNRGRYVIMAVPALLILPVFFFVSS